MSAQLRKYEREDDEYIDALEFRADQVILGVVIFLPAKEYVQKMKQEIIAARKKKHDQGVHEV
jgi:hypothetical protein